MSKNSYCYKFFTILIQKYEDIYLGRRLATLTSDMHLKYNKNKVSKSHSHPKSLFERFLNKKEKIIFSSKKYFLNFFGQHKIEILSPPQNVKSMKIYKRFVF